jgi:WD40 repeat protein
MATGAAVAVAKAGRSTAPKRNFASRLFGYDVFISFALGPPPRGTQSYASDLARRLRERDFTVFFSEDEASPGEQLDSTLLKALLRSRTLVVIANRGTLQEPRWVRQEVEQFRSRHPVRPIIPISVAGALQDATLAEQTQWLQCKEKIWLDESDDAVAQGIASDDLVKRLALAPAGRSSNVKWRWVVRAVVAVLLALTVAAIGFARYAQKQRTAADKSADEAQKQAAVAEQRRKEAVAAADSEKTARIAETAARKEADASAKKAEHQQAIAERNSRESKARELAALSTGSLGEDPEKSILLAMHAVNATVQFGQPPVPAAEEVLHQAVLSSQVRLTLNGHTADVESVAWSPDGKRLATGSHDGTAKVWDAASGQPSLTLKGHDAKVLSVAWSPDGKRLATGSGDNTAKVWDAASGQEMLTLKGHKGPVYSAAWSPNGKRLATGSGDNTAKVWDAASGHELLTVTGPVQSVVSVAWCPDGKRLATASWDQPPKVWNAASAQLMLTLKGHNGSVQRVAWSPNGKRLATASYDNTAKVWDAARGQEVLTLKGQNGWVESVAWSPDGKRLATGSGDQTAKVWDASSGQELLTLKGHSHTVFSVAWSPDGKRLAAASADTVQIYAMDPRLLLDLARARVTRDFTPEECKHYFQSEKCPPLP